MEARFIGMVLTFVQANFWISKDDEQPVASSTGSCPGGTSASILMHSLVRCLFSAGIEKSGRASVSADLFILLHFHAERKYTAATFTLLCMQLFCTLLAH